MKKKPLSAAMFMNVRSTPGPWLRRVHLEPLEQRQLLAGNTFYVDDNWIDSNGGFLEFGDVVESSSDPVNNSIFADYGITAFGKADTVSAITGAHYLDGA